MYKPLKLKRIWLGLGLLWVAVVIYLSTTPNPPDTSGIQFGDKIFHTIAYFGLFYWFGQIYQKSHYWQPAFALIFLGIALEMIQSALGYRTLEVFDMVANTSGVILAWLVAHFGYSNLFHAIENFVLTKH